jgi:hypothetical protein
VPTITICTTKFVALASQLLESMNAPNLRLVVVDHPLGDVDEQGVAARAHVACEAVLAYFGRGRGGSPP